MFFRLKVKEESEFIASETRVTGVLDPLLIDPLGRTRLKKLKTRPWTAGAREPQVQSYPQSVFDVTVAHELCRILMSDQQS